MTKLGEVYVCKTCGNKVKVVGTGIGTLVCCGKPMNLATA
jgi:superoxide reductase